MRHKLTIRLIISHQSGLRKLTRRSIEEQDAYYKKQEKEVGWFIDKNKMFYSLYR